MKIAKATPHSALAPADFYRWPQFSAGRAVSISSALLVQLLRQSARHLQLDGRAKAKA